MTSDPKPLPIPTYAATIDAGGNISPLREWEGGDWCKAADVRELADRMEKAEVLLKRLALAARELADCAFGAGDATKVRWDVLHALAAIDKEDNA